MTLAELLLADWPELTAEQLAEITRARRSEQVDS
jgi:uncharacterized protein (DUF433 family)